MSQTVAPEAPPPPATTIWRALGEVVAVLGVAPGYKFFTLADLEWMVLPALAAQQFRIAHRGVRPIGIALWARIDEATEAQMLDPRFKLRPDQWTSGDRIWVTDLVHLGRPDPQLVNAMLADVRAVVGPGAAVRVRPAEIMARQQAAQAAPEPADRSAP